MLQRTAGGPRDEMLVRNSGGGKRWLSMATVNSDAIAWTPELRQKSACDLSVRAEQRAQSPVHPVTRLPTTNPKPCGLDSLQSASWGLCPQQLLADTLSCSVEQAVSVA